MNTATTEISVLTPEEKQAIRDSSLLQHLACDYVIEAKKLEEMGCKEAPRICRERAERLEAIAKRIRDAAGVWM